MVGTSSPVHAPELKGENLTWFNVTTPLQLERLRGKLVILDFWTFCCINCMHILQSLRRVEEAFPEEAVVIGVHSPKFAAERDPANVAAAIARYGIVHPVVHDPDLRIWRAYAVRAWPTLIFISPEGRVVGKHSGEISPNNLLRAVGQGLAQWREAGELQPGALELAPPTAPSGRLRFPGKIKQAPGRDKSWVLADGGHHQIVLFDDRGTELVRYGDGRPGLHDGAGNEALFDNPQGLIATTDAIFVADTGNHALRRIDRISGWVTTLAGTGERGLVLGDPAPGLATSLASPWDVEFAGELVFFANAGTHQLGVLDLASGKVRLLAGSGGEGITDGPSKSAELAQPSGLALSTDGALLYFVDSETSSLRALTLNDGARVTTLIGTGLFDFGHVNGALSKGRLQHPLGLACSPGLLAIADSYNQALRIVDLKESTLADLDKNDLLCTDPVCLPLAEPAGIALDGAARLLVVDTNNHRILEYDLAGKQYRSWVA